MAALSTRTLSLETMVSIVIVAVSGNFCSISGVKTSTICFSLFVCHLFVICLLQVGISMIPWSALSLFNVGTSTTTSKQAQQLCDECQKNRTFRRAPEGMRIEEP